MPGDTNNAGDADGTSSFVPAPSTEELYEDGGKFMIVKGLFESRNKIPGRIPYHGKSCSKPAVLAKLSNDVFQRFVQDLQLSMRTNYWRIHWPILSSIFAVFVIVPLFVASPYDSLGLYLTACLASVVFIGWRYSKQHDGLQFEMETRIQEWQPLFEKQGFQVDYIVDKHRLLPTETYIHIHRLSVGGASSSLSPASGKEEAKYLLLFPRLFRRRNRTFRAVPLSILSKDPVHYAKPPALQNLSDEVFQSLMNDMRAALRSLMVKKLYLYFLLFIVWLILHYYLAFGSPTVALFLIVLLFVLDQFVVDHHPILSAKMIQKIEEWKPRIEAHGFTVEYVVDEGDARTGECGSWKEGYMLIRVQSLWVQAAAV